MARSLPQKGWMLSAQEAALASGTFRLSFNTIGSWQSCFSRGSLRSRLGNTERRAGTSQFHCIRCLFHRRTVESHSYSFCHTLPNTHTHTKPLCFFLQTLLTPACRPRLPDAVPAMSSRSSGKDSAFHRHQRAAKLDYQMRGLVNMSQDRRAALVFTFNLLFHHVRHTLFTPWICIMWSYYCKTIMMVGSVWMPPHEIISMS